MTDTEVTDTATTVGSIVQLTEAQSPPRRWIWQAEPLAKDVLTFGTLPDPRDARIAELETALDEIYAISNNWSLTAVDRLEAIRNAVHAALMPEPEASMSITVEELPA